MAIRSNRYSDPALGAAFENIASLFAPPSSGDMANYANAAATREKASRLAQLFANPNDPNFDRLNIAVGNYAPTSSFYAQDQNNATSIRGQDVTAATSRSNNAADNARALATNSADNRQDTIATMFGPRDPYHTAPAMPAEVAGLVGLPALSAQAGLPKPLSETEWRAGQNERLLNSGGLTDDMLLDAIVGDKAPVKVVGDNGQPVFQSPGAAVRQGQTAFVDKGAEAAKKAVLLVDPATKTQRPGYFDPTDGRTYFNDGSVAPPSFVPYNLGSPTGTNADLGIGKPASNNIDQQLIDISVAQDTAVKLRDLVAKSPASQGSVGWLRGTAQNVIQTGGELGQYFGGAAEQINEAIQNGAADANLAGSFDPNLPTVEFLSNLLAFQHAKTTTGERLSNEMLKQSRAALGLDGWTSNQADSLARLQAAIDQMGSQAGLLKKIKSEGTAGAGVTPPAPAAVGIKPNADMPTVNSPEEALALPSGTQFRDPQGNIRVVP